MRKTAAEALEGMHRGQKGETGFIIERTRIIGACAALKEAGFEHLTLITGVDWKTRFEVIYHLTRIGTRDMAVLRVTLNKHDPSIPSVESLWPGAGWHERETYDLLGIRFIGNSDLRRILLPEGFDGHPLRKEVRYGNTS